MKHGLSYRTIEQGTLGGTVAHYPRGKIVMTAPVNLPLVGKVRLTETTKEDLLAFWTDVERRTGVEIRYQERLESLECRDRCFLLRTTRGTCRARTVLLAVGRRGTPRKLGVPGEELSKVTYSLIDPAQYRDRSVLVVGGGDSALEAACSIADERGTQVSLVYRGNALGRAKQKNRDRVQDAAARGRLAILLQSKLTRITPEAVSIEQEGRAVELPNHTVIVCAGGIPPAGFLRSIGVEVEAKHGTA
jgi:thioredoxin reductase